MLLFTSIASIGKSTGLGYRLTAGVAAVFCFLGGIALLRYPEKRILKDISEKKAWRSPRDADIILQRPA